MRQHKNRLENLKPSPDKQRFTESMLSEIASWTATAYVGLWRFMQEYAQLNGRVRNKAIKNNWCSKDSSEALKRCAKALLSPENNIISSAAYPLILLTKAFPLCNGFNDDGLIKNLEYT